MKIRFSRIMIEKNYESCMIPEINPIVTFESFINEAGRDQMILEDLQPAAAVRGILPDA